MISSVAAKNFDVTFDPSLSFDKHIKVIPKTALCNIAKILFFLSKADAETENVLFSVLPRASTKSLQMVQNAAATTRLLKVRTTVHIRTEQQVNPDPGKTLCYEYNTL